jgi:hypothetical protein
MRNLIALLILSVTLINSGLSQEMTLKGNLVDTTNNVPVQGAVITVIRLSDSVLLNYSRPDKNGAFNMVMPMDTVEVIISNKGNDDKSIFYFPSPNNLTLDLPNLSLPHESDELAEIMIVAYKEPIYFRGDTLVYVADSFAVKQNAVVEDLLKKLPGITVDGDGKISSQGREVNKILVDGDEFFGDDPTIATKNLGADGVESVQVYETDDENAEAGSDEKIQVMDLKLKEGAKKGYFGRASAATDVGLSNLISKTGTDDFKPFYEGEMLFNKFSGKKKFSFFALGSNTPRSGFNWAEANKFGLTNEYSGNRYSGMGGGSVQPQGVPRTFKSGLYYSDKISKNIKMKFDYTYNNNDLTTMADQTSQYFLADTTYYTDDQSTKLEQFESHLVNFTFDIKVDSLSTLKVRPRFKYNKSSALGFSQTTFRTRDLDTTSLTNINDESSQDNYEAGVKTSFNKKFKKKKRSLVVNYNFKMTNYASDLTLKTNSDYVFSPSLNDSIDQQQTQSLVTSSHQGQIYYTEPLNEKFLLGFDYLTNYSDNKQDKITNNSIGGEYIDFDDSLSNDFSTQRFLNRGGLKLTYKKGKVTTTLGTQFRHIKINNVAVNGASINQSFNDILPNASLMLKFSNSKRIRLNYRTSAIQPTISQLQPVPDNTDPNRISVGNLNLTPNYSHRINGSFNTWKALTGFYAWSQINYTITNNDFSTATTFDSLGRTVSQAINVDGNQNGNFLFSTGLPIKKTIKFTPTINLNYNKFSSLINSSLNTTQTSTANGSLKFEYNSNSDSLNFSLGGSYGYSSPKSTLSFGTNRPFITQTIFGTFEVELPFKLSFETDATYTINAQRADGYNLNFLIINAELSRRFLKTENLILSVVGNDILNQNIIASRTIQGNTITDNRTSIISRYFLLKMTLKFNNRRTKEEDPRGHW